MFVESKALHAAAPSDVQPMSSKVFLLNLGRPQVSSFIHIHKVQYCEVRRI